MEQEYISDNSSQKKYTSFEIKSDKLKKERRITNILEITNSLAHKNTVCHILSTHNFKNKLSLEKKLFVILFNLYTKSNEIFRLINLIKLFPGSRSMLIKYNMTEFNYSKELDFNRIVYKEIYIYLNKFVSVKYDYEEYTKLIGCSKPEVVALFVLLKGYDLEWMYQVCKLSQLCELNELKNVSCKVNKINQKKRSFSKKVTLKKVFDKLIK